MTIMEEDFSNSYGDNAVALGPQHLFVIWKQKNAGFLSQNVFSIPGSMPQLERQHKVSKETPASTKQSLQTNSKEIFFWFGVAWGPVQT